MDWQAIVLSLVSGIAGILLGSYITVREQEKAQDRLDRGAARVTYFELVENSDYLESAMKFRKTVPLTTATWSETRARLAAMLGPEEFVDVAIAYARIRAVELAWTERPLGSGEIGSSTLDVTNETREQVEAAAALLLTKGWPDPAEQSKVQAKAIG